MTELSQVVKCQPDGACMVQRHSWGAAHRWTCHKHRRDSSRKRHPNDLLIVRDLAGNQQAIYTAAREKSDNLALGPLVALHMTQQKVIASRYARCLNAFHNGGKEWTA